jgi:hypothetical protein
MAIKRRENRGPDRHFVAKETVVGVDISVDVFCVGVVCVDVFCVDVVCIDVFCVEVGCVGVVCVDVSAVVAVTVVKGGAVVVGGVESSRAWLYVFLKSSSTVTPSLPNFRYAGLGLDLASWSQNFFSSSQKVGQHDLESLSKEY